MASHEPIPSPARRIVVPIGGSDREFLAQEQAVEYAAALGIPLAAVHVSVAPDEADGGLFDYVKRLAERHQVACDCLTLYGDDPAVTLQDELDGMDLLVVGTENLGTRKDLDSHTKRLLGHAPCNVQVVRLPASQA